VARGKLSKQNREISKYLGPTLMPQAGVALGLTVVAGQLVPDYATDIRVIILVLDIYLFHHRADRPQNLPWKKPARLSSQRNFRMGRNECRS
jgi:hypothetical protein